MKIRTGFVSNSSSSSFICDVCGRVESGYNQSVTDFDMCKCAYYDHTYCREERITLPEGELNVDGDGYEYTYSEDNSKCCPICQLTALTDGHAIAYLLKRCGLTKKQLIAEVKDKFETFEAFKTFLRG